MFQCHIRKGLGVDSSKERERVEGALAVGPNVYQVSDACLTEETRREQAVHSALLSGVETV